MRFKPFTPSPLLAGAVLMALWMAFGGLSASSADADTAAPRPYAETKWIKLGAIRPATTAAPDVYVRLISVDGEMLLPERQEACPSPR